MPVPKKKMSKARSRKRRGASFKAKAPNVVACSQCGSPKLPHRACPTCGYYKGRKAV